MKCTVAKQPQSTQWTVSLAFTEEEIRCLFKGEVDRKKKTIEVVRNAAGENSWRVQRAQQRGGRQIVYRPKTRNEHRYFVTVALNTQGAPSAMFWRRSLSDAIRAGEITEYRAYGQWAITEDVQLEPMTNPPCIIFSFPCLSTSHLTEVPDTIVPKSDDKLKAEAIAARDFFVEAVKAINGRVVLGPDGEVNVEIVTKVTL